MKTRSRKFNWGITATIFTFSVAFVICGCERGREMPRGSAAKPTTPPDPLAVVLVPHAGTTRVDAEIRDRQAQVRAGASVEMNLERLGWLFVAKARETFDPGFYKLAEQCALGLAARNAGSPEALLLRGHALQSQHRFHEAEALAQELVRQRGLALCDWRPVRRCS